MLKFNILKLKNVSVLFIGLYFLLLANFAAHAKLIPSSFRVEFLQTHKSLIKKRKKTTPVKLDYRYPSQLVLRTGDSTVYTSNGKKTWFYTAPFIETEKGEVVIQRQANLGLLSFFDSLSRGIEKYNKKKYNYTLIGDKLSFVFTKSGKKELGLQEIIFSLKKKAKNISRVSFSDVQNISIRESGKKPVLLEVKNVNTHKKFSPRHFYFQIPDNTKVVQR